MTRRCDMACSYCNIIKDKDKIKELNLMQKKRALRIMKDRKVGIVVLYGGEPTILGNELVEIIKYCNQINLDYAIMSNCKRLLEDYEYLRKIIEARPRNWTASIDTLNEGAEGDIRRKSLAGLDILFSMAEGGVHDLVACITVTRKNIEEIPQLVKTLSKRGIWSIISMINVGKKGFQYSSPEHKMKDLLFKSNTEDIQFLNGISAELIDMKQSGKYLMHDEIVNFEAWPKYAITQDWHCSKFVKFTVDADGSLLCCVDWHGKKNYNILEMNRDSRFENFLKEFYFDTSECPGCNWSPLILLEELAKDPEMGKAKIAHKV